MQFKRKLDFTYTMHVLIVALIIVSFTVSSLMISRYVEQDCFDRIEETTVQMVHMLDSDMEDNRTKLEMLADILAANKQNPDSLLQVYMENFCHTHRFSSLCVHRANGTTVSYGEHPHQPESFRAFQSEVAAAPYISSIYSMGDSAAEKMFYQAVPVVRDGETVAVLYGYMTLEVLPQIFPDEVYGGKGQLYIIDADTGDFLMDTWHDGVLGNIFDGSMGERETKPGYDMEHLRSGVRRGESGYHVFRSRTTGDWFYTYYMPTGVNNWSFQMTIDEPTAFASFNYIVKIIVTLGFVVVLLTMLYIFILMLQGTYNRKRDLKRIRKTDYMYKVQRILFNAHSNSELIERALKITGTEVNAETMLLLTFADNTVSKVYHWPITDKSQAADLLGRSIKEDFPHLFDVLSEGRTVIYGSENTDIRISDTAKALFAEFGVEKIMLVPMIDNDLLCGVLCAVNPGVKPLDAEMLECVLYDYFMAARNVENYSIIKNMGVMDYLTDMKNRNSYEVELAAIAAQKFERLWCVFVDVNGLHEINNRYGHKAGDLMLCTVAKVMKRAFGSERTYRMGGDEFVSFVINETEDRIKAKKELVETELAANGYYVSVGYSMLDSAESDVFDIERLVASAEAMMYQEKDLFYERHNEIRDRRDSAEEEKE